MKVTLNYSKQAIKYIRKSNAISKEKCDSLLILALKRIYKNEISTINIKKLSGQDSTYRIRYGDLRILFSVDKNGDVVIALVELIAPRGDVYKKMR